MNENPIFLISELKETVEEMELVIRKLRRI